MAIIINGMDMPKNCAECPFCDYEEAHCIAANDKPTTERRYNEREPWCPLTEKKNEIDALMARALTPEWQKAHMDMGFISPLGELYKALGVYDDGEMD